MPQHCCRGIYFFFSKFLMMVTLSFQLIIISSVGCAFAEPLPPLRVAESMVGDGPEVLAAIAAMSRDEQLAQLERQRMGAKYFFNTTFGYSDEPLFETSEESASYSKIGVSAGLSFPIFGTWSRQKISALESEIRSIESRYRPRILKLHNITALRKAYVTLWSECEKAAAAKRFLETEEETSKILTEREKNGLILPADKLEFMSAYDFARRDIALSEMRKTQALQIIRLATGRLWEMPQSIEIPDMPAFDSLKANIAGHPEIAMRKETLRKYESLMHEKRNTEREGSFTIGATAAKDFPGEIGSGVYASVTVSGPLGTASSGDGKIKKAAEQDLKRAEREELFMRIKVQGEAEESASLASYAVADIKAQESRLAALTEAVRERLMRHASLAGDTFEQLQKSRYQYYRGVMDILESEMIFMQTGADLLAYAYPEGPSSEPAERIRPIADNPLRSRMLDPDWLTSHSSAPGGSGPISAPQNQLRADVSAKTAPAHKKGPLAVYVWDASPFLAPETRMSSLSDLRSKGFDHFLISFTAEQIDKFDSYYGMMELKDLLSAAERMGLRADLLLGEPTWLYPEERKDLIRIVEKMKKFRFKGIHLDIEPDSLPNSENRRQELLEYLKETVKEVKLASDMKLSLSVHPRYLEGGPDALSSESLAGLDLEYISVMIYTTDLEKAVRRMRAIMMINPSQHFCLAQSVERVLSPAESYFLSGEELYREKMDIMGRELSANRGFSGLIIQAWEDLGGMKK